MVAIEWVTMAAADVDASSIATRSDETFAYRDF
jgi:hypothetical protein